jgi:hypothetical protein
MTVIDIPALVITVGVAIWYEVFPNKLKLWILKRQAGRNYQNAMVILHDELNHPEWFRTSSGDNGGYVQMQNFVSGVTETEKSVNVLFRKYSSNNSKHQRVAKYWDKYTENLELYSQKLFDMRFIEPDWENLEVSKRLLETYGDIIEWVNTREHD